MTTKSKAVYLGNTDGEYCGFTVGKEYEVYIYDAEDGYMCAIADDGGYRYINNGAFHKFGIHDDEDLVNEAECSCVETEPKAKLRYYINGHEVDSIEFGNVGNIVCRLNEDGVKCDTINFEVKFE